MTSGFLPADEATISTCGASQEGVMRVNKATPGVPQLEICNGNGLWVPASGGSTVPIGAVMAFDATSCPNGWTAISARSEEHTSELQSLMRISYAVFCLKKKNTQ